MCSCTIRILLLEQHINEKRFNAGLKYNIWIFACLKTFKPIMDGGKRCCCVNTVQSCISLDNVKACILEIVKLRSWIELLNVAEDFSYARMHTLFWDTLVLFYNSVTNSIATFNGIPSTRPYSGLSYIFEINCGISFRNKRINKNWK